MMGNEIPVMGNYLTFVVKSISWIRESNSQ
jgi:hypothetical protein